jgi:dCMP deaminase
MTKTEYYLALAEEVSKASKCLRSHFGAVIVKDEMIIGTGFNGPARGVKHCNPCRRAEDPSGVGYKKCIAVHAEANAIIQAGGRKGCLGAIMYLGSHNRKYNGTKYNDGMGDFPCNNCGRLIINAGIEYLVQRESGVAKVYHIPTLVAEGKLE